MNLKNNKFLTEEFYCKVNNWSKVVFLVKITCVKKTKEKSTTVWAQEKIYSNKNKLETWENKPIPCVLTLY